MTWKRKQENWQIESPPVLVNYEEHMRDHHEKLKLMSSKGWAKNQSNDSTTKNLPHHWRESGCTLAMFWSGNRFTQRR